MTGILGAHVETKHGLSPMALLFLSIKTAISNSLVCEIGFDLNLLRNYLQQTNILDLDFCNSIPKESVNLLLLPGYWRLICSVSDK